MYLTRKDKINGLRVTNRATCYRSLGIIKKLGFVLSEYIILLGRGPLGPEGLAISLRGEGHLMHIKLGHHLILILNLHALDLLLIQVVHQAVVLLHRVKELVQHDFLKL